MLRIQPESEYVSLHFFFFLYNYEKANEQRFALSSTHYTLYFYSLRRYENCKPDLKEQNDYFNLKVLRINLFVLSRLVEHL